MHLPEFTSDESYPALRVVLYIEIRIWEGEKLKQQRNKKI